MKKIFLGLLFAFIAVTANAQTPVVFGPLILLQPGCPSCTYTPYTGNFTGTTLTLTAATHGLGANVYIKLFDKYGKPQLLTKDITSLSVDTSGNISAVMVASKQYYYFVSAGASGAPNYAVNFSNQTAVTVLQSAHGFTTGALDVFVYTPGQSIGTLSLTSGYDVTYALQSSLSGRIIVAPALTAGLGQSANLPSSFVGVSTFNSRAPVGGNIIPTSGDYTASMITGAVSSVNNRLPSSGNVSVDFDARLQNAFDTLSAASYKHVDVAVFGDSLSVCWQGSSGTNGNCPATGPINKDALWVEILRNYLRKRYGNGGTGQVPFEASIGSTGTLDTSIYTFSATPNRMPGWLAPSVDGTDTGNGSLYQFLPGNTISLTVKDSTVIRLWGAVGGDNNGWTVTVDGVSLGGTFMTGAGGAAAAHADVTPASGRGDHTVVYTAAGSSGHSYAYSVEGVNPTGVSVHNFSMGSCTAACFGARVSTEMPFADGVPGGIALAYIALGTNEALNSISTSTFSTNEQNMITHLNGNGTQVVLMNSSWVQSANSAPYWAINAALATSNGIPLYDPATYLFISYNNQASNGLSTSEGIHLTNKGESRWGTWVVSQTFGSGQGTNVYIAAVNATPAFNGGTITGGLQINLTSGFSSELILSQSLSTSFASATYVADASQYITGAGGSGFGSCASGYFVWDNTNSAIRMCVSSTGTVTIPNVKSTTGTRYVCADTNGKLVSSATACSGT